MIDYLACNIFLVEIAKETTLIDRVLYKRKVNMTQPVIVDCYAYFMIIENILKFMCQTKTVEVIFINQMHKNDLQMRKPVNN